MVVQPGLCGTLLEIRKTGFLKTHIIYKKPVADQSEPRHEKTGFLYFETKDAYQLLWPICPVCVGPGRKPRRPIFSQLGSSICALHIKADSKYSDQSSPGAHICLICHVAAHITFLWGTIKQAILDQE